MNKSDLVTAIAADTGVNKTNTHIALTAIAQQLEAEGLAGRAVVFNDFGAFLPRRKDGLRTGRTISGGTITYDNWKLVADPEQLDEASFIQGAATRANLRPPQITIVLQSYKAQIVRTLRKGGSVHYAGYGSFSLGKKKARIYHRDDGSVSSRSPAQKVISYQSGKNGQHQKFVGLPGLL
jgi:nucleoid DNA-binding protein